MQTYVRVQKIKGPVLQVFGASFLVQCKPHGVTAGILCNWVVDLHGSVIKRSMQTKEIISKQGRGHGITAAYVYTAEGIFLYSDMATLAGDSRIVKLAPGLGSTQF